MLQQRQLQQLDEQHVLEPVDELDPDAFASSGQPLVRDVEGRLWRVRRRGTPLSAHLPVLLVVSFVCLLMVLAFSLVR